MWYRTHPSLPTTHTFVPGGRSRLSAGQSLSFDHQLITNHATTTISLVVPAPGDQSDFGARSLSGVQIHADVRRRVGEPEAQADDTCRPERPHQPDVEREVRLPSRRRLPQGRHVEDHDRDLRLRVAPRRADRDGCRGGEQSSEQVQDALHGDPAAPPSGRPQGILNIGLGLLDNTMRSMPLYSELSSSAVGYWDLIEGKGANQKNHDPNYKDQDKFIIFQRSQSDRTGSDYGFSKSRPASSICDGLSKSRASSTICNAATGGFSKTTKPQGSFCNSSIVNGSELSSAQKGGKGGSICSDVGPSPSVVAAAIAKGIYPLGHGGGNVVRHAAKGDARNSLLDEWTDQDSVEGLKTKIERWRTELPPVYDCKNKNNNNNNTSRHPKLLQSSHHGTNRLPKSRRSRSSGGSLFSCFALGCELSISCGGGKKSKKKSSGKVNLGTSDMTFDDSSYLG
ncbi:uncharacterized protein Pyn_22544 [Prunus yedoensis var. nudiflora]|uniref:Uncharacterized protein n=1 Tax=Prunus yedoensis var. nudiflora TaxID=2094558 RepID=A0A314ZLC7_PRUYE|nr:uncharacterized protein Pyn_22544 [Prunus yedoensis var. nudiflora]